MNKLIVIFCAVFLFLFAGAFVTQKTKTLALTAKSPEEAAAIINRFSGYGYSCKIVTAESVSISKVVYRNYHSETTELHGRFLIIMEK